MVEKAGRDTRDDSAEAGAGVVDICIPAFDARVGAGVRRAYADALAREIEAAAPELANAGVAKLRLHGAGHLGEEGLAHVLAAARRAIPDFGRAAKVAFLEPNLMSTSLMTPLRNCAFDLYDIDLGSLSPTEFHGLAREYSYETYELTKRLLDAYELREWRAACTLGMPGQTSRTFADALDRLRAWDPGAVRLDVRRTVSREEPPASACNVAAGLAERTLPPELAARADKAIGLLAQADEALVADGYVHCNLLEWAKPAYARLAGSGTPNSSWGFGLGATSYLDGCLVRNTNDLARYLEACEVVGAPGGEGVSEGGAPSVFEGAVCLDDVSRARLEVRRALEQPDGLDEAELDETAGSAALVGALTRLGELGLVAREDGHVRLTPRGVVLSPLAWDVLDEA